MLYSDDRLKGGAFSLDTGDSASLKNSQPLITARPVFQGVTVDPPYPAEIDDAIWIRRDGLGYVAEVSIAQAASVIPFGSELDLKARQIGFTRYRGTESLNSMLPRQLAEIDLSFLPGQPRLAVTLSIPFSFQNGQRLVLGETVFSESVLRSCRQFSYREAGKELQQLNGSEFAEPLRDLAKLATHLFESRRQRGDLGSYDQQRGIAVNEEGRAVRVPAKAMAAYMMVTELMILANTTTAEYFKQNGLLGLFRNHLGQGSSNRSRAVYAPEPQGHCGLNLTAYMHFTSPLRRYIDMLNHHVLSAHLNGAKPPFGREELVQIATDINQLRRARKRWNNLSLRRPFNVPPPNIEHKSYLNCKCKDLVALIDTAVQRGRLPTPLRDEVLRRLGSGGTAATILFRVVFLEGQEDPVRMELRRKAQVLLDADPKLRSHLLAPLVRKCKATSSAVVKKCRGDNPGWNAKLNINLRNGQTYSVELVRALKSAARIAARAVIFSQILESNAWIANQN